MRAGTHLPRSTAPGARVHAARAVRSRHVRLRGRFAGQDRGLRRLLPVHPAAGEGGRYSLAGQRPAAQAQRPALPPAGRPRARTTPRRLAARQLPARAREPARERRRRRRPLPLLARGPEPSCASRLSGGFRVQLLRDNGHACGCGSSDDGCSSAGVQPGRYFVAVRGAENASGRYVLPACRARGHEASIHDRRKQSARTSGRGGAVRIAVHIKPAVAGPVRITIERFDPFAGWQFNRRLSAVASGGTATVAFTPPSRAAGARAPSTAARGSPRPAPPAWRGVLVASSP